MPRKRHRGGQPGNQNARKHGPVGTAYAKNFSPQESCEYWNIINTTGASPEAAALRLKMQSVFRNAPNNYPILRDISKLLVKQYNAQYPLGKEDNREFKRVVRTLIKALAGATAAGDKESINEYLSIRRIIAESAEIAEKSNNDSYLEQIID